MLKNPFSTPLKVVAMIGATVAATAIAVTDVQAQSNGQASAIWKDIGAVERVDFAGRMHMHAQRIAASTCNLEAGILPDISRGLLAGSTREMERIMGALRNGNPMVKIIGAEENPRVLAIYETMDTQWTPVRSTIQALMDDSDRREDFEVIGLWTSPFHSEAELLVSEIAAEYSDPASLLQRDAILVDLASRQRMRTQKILKQSCEIWRDGATRAEREALLETIQLFETTLDALRFGADDVGIKGAPSEKLDAELAALSDQWDGAKLTLATVAQGRRVSDQAINTLYLGLNDMLIRTDGIVQEYARFSKPSY